MCFRSSAVTRKLLKVKGSKHTEEVACGREAELVVYQCRHHHRFLVVGPHLYCRCSKPTLVINRTEDYQLLDKRDPAAWLCELRCSCGADTLGTVHIRKRVLRRNAAVFYLAGYKAIAGELGLWDLTDGRGFYDYGWRMVPKDFPRNTVQGYLR